MNTFSPPGPMGIGELDDFVATADRLAQESHARRNQFLMSRWVPYAEPPKDAKGALLPFGGEHARWVVEQWKEVSGRQNYQLDLEHDVNVSVSEQQLSRLYPFVSGDTGFIANYMLGVYFALKLFEDAPSRSLVEYGVGWGNATVAIMQAGFDVLAVDIDPKWLGLLELRAAKMALGGRLRTLRGEFGDLPPDDGTRLGGALFFECFHHSLNHDDTLRKLVSRMLTGGVILFAAEPIFREYPVEWGLRQDGHSVWAIRRFGWMELGFSDDYFVRLCRRHNLTLTRHFCEAAGSCGLVFKAVVNPAGFAMGPSLLTSNESGFHATEVDPAVITRFTTGLARIDLPCGPRWVDVELRNWLTVPLACALHADGQLLWQGQVEAFGTRVVTLPNTVDGYFRSVELRSDVRSPLLLGINDDPRELGIAVGRIRLHDAAPA